MTSLLLEKRFLLTRKFLSDIIGEGKNCLPIVMQNDTIELKDGMTPWGHSDYEFLIQNNMSENIIIPNSPATPWKYNEEEIVKELLEYIRGTYTQHYSAGDDQIQTLDLIEACGDGEAFCRSNILKYASRYDKKGTARRDIMKIMHYAVLLMNFNDKNAQRETYPNR